MLRRFMPQCEIKQCHLLHLAFCKLTGVRTHRRVTGGQASRQSNGADMEGCRKSGGGGGGMMYLLWRHFTPPFALLCFLRVCFSS